MTTELVNTVCSEVLVASVPASHVYVEHLSPVDILPGQDHVIRLGDPDPEHPHRTTTSHWWPPVMLDSQWVTQHPEVDVFHLQFGFDAKSPEQLRDWVSTLRRHRKPLVYTVHDLRNPHHLRREMHDAQLNVLIPAADALITLTRGAADEIRRRWGREATVLPHPHVVDLETMTRLGRERASSTHPNRPFTVGVHVKSLRACMDPLALLPGLIRAVQQIPGAVLQINGHTDVLAVDGARYDVKLANALAALPACVEIRVHDFLPDAQLWDYLGSLDVSVLPYRFGTHSGWLEACRDLGTAVVAPSCGYYAEQGEVSTFTMDEWHFDEESLVDAVLHAYRRGPVPPVSAGQRREERQRIAMAHSQMYRNLVAV